MSATTELLGRIRAATGPDSSLDVAFLPFWAPDHDALKTYDDRLYETEFRDGGFSVWKKDGGYSTSTPFPRFTASVDAILALIERELPGWGCEANKVAHSGRGIARIYPGDDNNATQTALGYGSTPALALCAAFLAAKQS